LFKKGGESKRKKKRNFLLSEKALIMPHREKAKAYSVQERSPRKRRKKDPELLQKGGKTWGQRM